jgi:molybdopterin/thiamine biosynthesis adenylyltransferase
LSVKKSENIPVNLYLIDGDEVEYKNLSRQNFIEQDLGKNKAEVMAKRYSRAFDININAMTSYLSAQCTELEEICNNDEYNVIISCVDNVATRLGLTNLVRTSSKFKNAVLIDCGNSEYTGQVIYSHAKMPLFDDVFPNTKPENDHPDDLSCADHAMSAPQNIATNMTAAQLAFNYFNIAYTNTLIFIDGLMEREIFSFILNKLIDVDNNIVYFDTRNNSFDYRIEREDMMKSIFEEKKSFSDKVNGESLFDCTISTPVNPTETTVSEVNIFENTFSNTENEENIRVSASSSIPTETYVASVTEGTTEPLDSSNISIFEEL